MKEKKQYQITLNKKRVEEAKNIQKKLAGAANISGLLDSLLQKWIETKNHVKFKSREVAK